jgi:acetoacetyl-CoA synthetase
MGRFLTQVAAARSLRFTTYEEAWAWSVREPEAFWGDLAAHLGVRFVTPAETVLTSRDLPGARWFPGATLNYAEHALRPGADDAPAIVGTSQARGPERLDRRRLRRDVARCAAGLRRLGVSRGDHVAAYLPNTSEAVVAFLAAASLGAVWSSCAPEFGVEAVVDRLQQVAPTVLLAVPGYRYGARTVDRTQELARIRAALPSLTCTVLVDLLPGRARPDGPEVMSWDELLAVGPGEPEPMLTCIPVPFDHPLYVLFSSGSTGLPKPIVHGHGGILLEHLKLLALQQDLDATDVLLWVTTTGWMMWNYLVSGLLVGATIVLLDGDATYPGLDEVWRVAAHWHASVIGVGAPYLARCASAGLDLPVDVDLSVVRQIGSTGAPLPPSAFTWVAERFGPDVQVASLSGGTDVCSAFVGPSPLMPVRLGEISSRCLGADVAAFDEAGDPVIGSLGELVVRTPMPSMPVGFHGDVDGARYREAYFARYPGVWHHGDWIEVTAEGGCVISGRSDATLNRGGIRTGTAEYYAVVEAVPGVRDSLVVHLEDPEGGPGELVLLLVTDDDPSREVRSDGTSHLTLDLALTASIHAAVRERISPRHAPDRLLRIPAVPRTVSGKKVEVPVKRLLAGGDPAAVVARDALADPTTWDRLVAALRAG